MPEKKFIISTDRPPEEKPEAKEAREAKGKESEFLSAFFELCDIYNKLRNRKKQDVANLVLDVERDWKEKTIELTPAQEERLIQVEDGYQQIFDELDVAIKRFFDSPYTQEIFKRHLGQEIHSLDEADQFRQKLLEPFYNKFKELELQEKKGRRRVSPEVLQKQSDQALEQATVKDLEWNEALKKLKVLPGRHQPELIAYLKFNKSKDTQSLLLGGQPLDRVAESTDEYRRFGMLEPLETEEDLIKLEDQIKQAKMVLAKTKSTWLPLLEKAEKFFPKETFTAIKAKREEKEKERRGKTGEALAREMRELFKEGFFGLEEVETAFTLQDGKKLVELSAKERETAFRLLEAKLNEPDIEEFLRETPKKRLAENWLLVLRLPKLRDGASLTMKTMREKLAPDMQARNQGKLLYQVEWYANESFYTTDSPKDMHWQFVTREVAPETKGKNHSIQTEELKKAAKAVHLDPAKTRRRAPVETLFDSFVSLRAKGQYILETAGYDWSDVSSSVGHFVGVGLCGAEGAGVAGWLPEGSGGSLGASLSR